MSDIEYRTKEQKLKISPWSNMELISNFDKNCSGEKWKQKPDWSTFKRNYWE